MKVAYQKERLELGVVQSALVPGPSRKEVIVMIMIGLVLTVSIMIAIHRRPIEVLYPLCEPGTAEDIVVE